MLRVAPTGLVVAPGPACGAVASSHIGYLTSEQARSGGFFPSWVNGSINTSGYFDSHGD